MPRHRHSIPTQMWSRFPLNSVVSAVRLDVQIWRPPTFFFRARSRPSAHAVQKVVCGAAGCNKIEPRRFLG